MPGGAGPGACVPYLDTNSRHDRNASAPGTRCSMTAGIKASSTWPVRPRRKFGSRRCAAATAETTQRVFGDADAVSVGDYHIPKMIGWTLVGRPVDDAGMLELLEPMRPHRHRVVRLLEASGLAREPRRGPRLPVQNIRAL